MELSMEQLVDLILQNQIDFRRIELVGNVLPSPIPVSKTFHGKLKNLKTFLEGGDKVLDFSRAFLRYRGF